MHSAASTPTSLTTVVAQADDVARVLYRMARQIAERHSQAARLVLLGIPTRGVPLANRLAFTIRGVLPTCDVQVFPLEIAAFRDDRDRQRTPPTVGTAQPATDLDDQIVIVVDDVLHTARTMRAALDAATHLGRARSINIAVLVDRGHRDLPIRADVVGKNIPSAPHDRVQVHLTDIDGRDEILLHHAPSVLTAAATERESHA